MKVYNYNEVNDDLSVVLDSALSEEVIIKNKDGLNFKLSQINENNNGKSPLEGIKGIKANISTLELVEIIREGRAGI
jgi:hypothetical protein